MSIMKTISLQIEDHLYTTLITLIQQLHSDKVQILQNPQPAAIHDNDKANVSNTNQ